MDQGRVGLGALRDAPDARFRVTDLGEDGTGGPQDLAAGVLLAGPAPDLLRHEDRPPRRPGTTRSRGLVHGLTPALSRTALVPPLPTPRTPPFSVFSFHR